MSIKAVVNQVGKVGKVSVSQINNTTISAPNYRPKLNIALSDIVDVSADVRQDGDTLIYNSDTGEYESVQLANVAVNITNINGGNF